MRPLVLYTGPSAFDGAPIVALATLGSSNVKTGPMVQTWILRSDMTPVEASKSLSDRAVCGDCPRRQSTGGDCYVLIHNGPQSTWKAWDRSGKPAADLADVAARIARDAKRHGIRLGSYGDPAAVPFQVWRDLLAMVGPVRHTGYTHQWRATLYASAPQSYAHHAWCRENLMASCDSPQDAALARAAGWRYFVALPASALAGAIPERTVECLADRAVSPRTCETCGICDGSQGRPSRASVYIAEHGMRSSSKAKRAAALMVLR